MLTLFPFESDFYRQHQVKVAFVGHPLADTIPLQVDQYEARSTLSQAHEGRLVALLPGSRQAEVEKMTEIFFDAAQLSYDVDASMHFIVPAAYDDRFAQIQEKHTNAYNFPLKIVLGQSQTVMAAADSVVMASGTASLEAMLLKKPMIIGYRMASLSYFLLKRLVKSAYIGLPNLLAGKELVPELIQDDLTPQKLSEHMLALREDKEGAATLVEQFTIIHKSLRKNASEVAAGGNTPTVECGGTCVMAKSQRFIAGVDEVGRGPLAGDVVAAAVILGENHGIEGLADSKKLSEAKRERLYKHIIENAFLLVCRQSVSARNRSFEYTLGQFTRDEACS